MRLPFFTNEIIYFQVVKEVVYYLLTLPQLFINNKFTLKPHPTKKYTANSWGRPKWGQLAK